MNLGRIASLARSVMILAAISGAETSADPGFAEEPTFAREGTELVTRLDVRAREFRRNAEDVNELAFQPEAHPVLVYRTRLNMLKEDLAKIKEGVSLLDRNRSQAAQWQVQLADQTIPRLQTLEGNINRALALLDRKADNLWAPNYETIVGDIRDQATGLSRTIDAFLRWASNEGRRN